MTLVNEKVPGDWDCFERLQKLNNLLPPALIYPCNEDKKTLTLLSETAELFNVPLPDFILLLYDQLSSMTIDVFVVEHN